MDQSDIEQYLEEKLDDLDPMDPTRRNEAQKCFDFLMLGFECYHSNKHEDAIENFTTSLTIAEKIKNQNLEFFGHYGLGYSYALNSHYGKTVDCFKRCLSIARNLKTSNGFELYSAYIALGEGCKFTGRSKDELEYYKKGLQEAVQMQDGERESIGHLKLADFYKIASEYARALEHYTKCLQKAEEQRDDPTVLQANQGLGDVYKLTGQFCKARNHYEECLKLSLELNDQYQQSLMFAALGDLYTHSGQCDKAFQCYEKCLRMEPCGVEQRDQSRVSHAYLGKGYASLLTGKCFEAIEHFMKCFSIAVDIRDKRLETSSMAGLGDAYKLTGDYTKAMENYEKSLDIATRAGLCDIEATAYLGIGDISTITGNYSKASQNIERCLKSSLLVGNQYHECLAYLGLGDVDVVQERYEAAKTNFKKGLDIATKISEKNCEVRARRGLGDACMVNSESEDAISQYKSALSIAEEIGNMYEKSRINLGLGRVYKSLGILNEALIHFEKGFSFVGKMSAKNTESLAGDVETGNDDDESGSTFYKTGLPFAYLVQGGYGALKGYWELGDLYYKLELYDKALELFERYLEIVEATKDMRAQENACKRLADTFEKLGRYSMMNILRKKEQEISKELETEYFESPKAWKWEMSSITHREKFKKLLEYGHEHPDEVKDVNGVRVCCSEEFLIGMGGEGTRVYVGLGKDGYERAVKRLPKDACTYLAEQERRVLNKLNTTESNYVVNYWFLDEESDKHYLFLIFDLCEETLEDYINRESLKDLESVAPEVIRQILKGLADLHRGPSPILHRDLKPSNILRNVQGKWLLADFGISRILTTGKRTHFSRQRGTPYWRAIESYPLSENVLHEEAEVRYKKESDIQVAGMVAYYIITKSQHPFGEEADRLRNLLDGRPVGLDNLIDHVAKDLVSWMLSHDPKDRPSAEEALKHPYLVPEEEKYELLCSMGNQHEIKTQDSNSNVVRQLNTDSTDWRTLISADVLKYLCTDYLNGRPKGFAYGLSWTECLRLIRNVNQHWKDRRRPRPQPEAFYVVGDPQQYFLKIFPDLPVEVHRIVRSCDWKERPELKKYFI